ncbi:MAG: hypothetical protein E7640_05115 [Ruminococcaceae bacterium]|nr:hypothetical protein [Oscillospiraceae bacterium]
MKGGGRTVKEIMPELIGNRALAERLGGEILAEKMPHAYIICGERGSGRHTIARLIAASLACENKNKDGLPLPCGTCESCRKILSGICPDVNIVGIPEDRATIGVETVRDLRFDVLSAPNDLDVKVYIIEDADKMTEPAQNAFLLTLEEPPQYVVFLLLCENIKAMLETVKSRAPILRTEPLTADQTENFLLKNDDMARLKRSSPDEFYEIVMASFGKLGRALELTDEKARAKVLAERLHVRRFVNAACSHTKGEELLEILQKFPTSRTECTDRLSLILLALRDLAILKRSDEAQLCFYHDRSEALELSDHITLTSLFDLIAACERASDAISRNANIKLTLTNLTLR